MFFPKISGIIATDFQGRFIHEDGCPITHESPVERLDRAILREYLSKFTKENGNAVFVTGDKNAEDMGGLLSSSFQSASVVVSSPSWVQSYASTSLSSPIQSIATTNPKDDVLYEALAVGMKKRANIYVLGGRSVYQAFRMQYSHFIHVETGHASRSLDTKRVNVYSDDPVATSGCLIHSSIGLERRVLINSQHLRVTEYTSEWWTKWM